MVRNLLPEMEIHTADSGMQGLQLAGRINPDMIFLDIAMPGMDGLEVCKSLHMDAETCNIPVLFLSSLDLSMREQLAALDMGAVDFLRKPIQAIELATRIRIMARLNDYTHRLEELVEAQTRRIEKQRAIASRTERLAAMGTLAAGIAHEINQPLNALKVTVDGLLYWHERNKPISIDEVYDGLRFVSRQCERIESIILHMRDLVQQNTHPSLGSIDIIKPVEQALSLIGQQLFAHGVKVEKRFEQPTLHAVAASTPVEQVVLNLLNNSLTALDRVERSEKRIVIHIYQEEDQVVLEISDNGPGIPAEDLENIFDPFFTSESSRGMGLGLSITQNLVVSLRGTLTVRNPEEGGACFTVSLPATLQEDGEG